MSRSFCFILAWITTTAAGVTACSDLRDKAVSAGQFCAMALSAHEFVRALKAAADPPQPGGPTKLDIARTQWHDSSVYVPNKEEAIVEWLLTRLLKEKDTETWVHPPRRTLFCAV